MKKKATIVNLGYGNINRLNYFLKRLGYHVTYSDSKNTFLSSDILVIPGIGNSKSIYNKKNINTLTKINYCKNQNLIIIGICLGMQIFCKKNEEYNDKNKLFSPLGFFPFSVKKMYSSENTRVPRIGWYETSFTKSNIRESFYLYYAHSYYINDEKEMFTEMHTYHNRKKITAVLRKNNILGFQFHPELSGVDGENIFNELVRKYDNR